MADAKRVTHPATPGFEDASSLPRRPHVVVIGGGVAGLAAATGLIERGCTVELIERDAHLGGRVAGWTERLDAGPLAGTDVAVNRGFHAFFRQYYNLRDLLRRCDPHLHLLRPVDDYPLIDGEGRVDTFEGLPTTPLWNAVVFSLRSPTFRGRDLARLNPVKAAPLAAVSLPGIYEQLDSIDGETFLREINFPPAARHLAFEVFARSFFARPEHLSAAELAVMFHIYFLGSSEGLLFDVAEANFTALWTALGGYLADRGVELRTGTLAESIAIGGSRALDVRLADGAVIEADGVVLAADIAGLQRIIEESPGLGDDDWRERVAGLQAAKPFVVQRLWLDRPVDSTRAAFLGTGGLDPVDNISVVSRYEREAAQWAAVNGGAVVEVHAYSVPGWDDVLRTRMLARLHQVYPETASATILAERVQVRQDCPLFAPGSHARRPTVHTPVPGLVLAGDGIRIDLPVALMERAATTGLTAANQLLAGWGLRGHTLHTVPVQGRYAPMRWLAQRCRPRVR